MPIDLHIHGIGALDTQTGAPDDILKMSEALKSNGTDAFLPTIYPSTIKNMRRQIHAISQAMQRQSEKQARILGVNLEGPFLNPNMCGALNKINFLPPSEYTFRELIDGFEDVIKIITIAPELDGALNIIRLATDLGITVSMGHSDATFNETDAGFNHGAKGITHLFNAMRGFHHRELGIAGFGLMNQEVYVEVIADGYHLHQKTIEMIFRLKRKDRVILISDMVRGKASYDGGMRSDDGRLLGGCMDIAKSSERLKKLGFDADTVNTAIDENPKRYISLTSQRSQSHP
ncbi:MAG: amidohydrolase family protein [Thermodesulfovibrionales bacterium]|nr:amidohydrolase family protein [Thermodesulfovibrionales bacterium]